MYDSRASGVLLAVSSLPGPYGIGSLGAPARRFVDFLADAGQTYWQILPLVPPGHGNSPYMSPFRLCWQPLSHRPGRSWCLWACSPPGGGGRPGDSPDRVDYAHLQATRMDLLYQAFLRSPGRRAQIPEEVHLPGWRTTPSLPPSTTSIRPIAASGPRTLSRTPSGWPSTSFLQDIFYQQWFHLKEYANQKGSASWGHPHLSLQPQRGVLLPPGVVPGGRSGPPDCGSRRASRCLHRRGSVLGQPPL